MYSEQSCKKQLEALGKLASKESEHAVPTAAQLAEELSDDADFMKVMCDTYEMRLQRAYDAMSWVQWWAWWKDGVQYVGLSNRTLKEAREEICKAFGVNLSDVENASGRLKYDGPMPF